MEEQMLRRYLILSAAALVGTVGVPLRARAQLDPRQILAAVIQQLQMGQPNPSWYGPQLWQTIVMQTGNTGFYPVLAQGGPVTNVQVTQQQQLPNGVMYQLTSTQANGLQLGWTMGISMMSNRIEFLNFNPVQSTPVIPTTEPRPGPSPAPPPNPNPNPPGGNPTPATPSEACTRFPNLC